MTLLVMLRHGETQWSSEKRIQGHTDVPLNGPGRAMMSGHRLPVEFAGLRVVSSPLRRCLETVESLGLGEPAIDARIAEMSWGQWEGRRLGDLRAQLGDAMLVNEAKGFDFLPAGGESPRQVLARVAPWLAEIAASGRDTLAVSHRGVIRVVFAAACGWDMLGRPPAKLDWRALHVFRIDQSGAPGVLRLNVPLDPVPLAAAQA